MNRVMALCAVLLLSTCASAQPDAAAVIENPTKESRAELVQAVSGALNGAPVTLADDALTRQSRLVIERAHRLNGRDLGGPEVFHLVKTGRQCALLHERSGKRIALASTTCQPVVP